MTSLTDEQVERFVVADQQRFSWARCRADIAPFITRHVTWRALAAGDAAALDAVSAAFAGIGMHGAAEDAAAQAAGCGP